MNLTVEHFTKYVRKSKVLDDVNLSLESGVIYGLSGENGSGKTMLLRAMAGLIYASSGHVAIEGKTLGKDLSFPPSVGILIENPSFIENLSGYKNLALLAGIRGDVDSDAICETLRSIGLDPDDKRPFRKYSLGMKQKLGIACAVMESPDIILLDEPLNALDSEAVELALGIIKHHKNRGALIVVAYHNNARLDSLVDVSICMTKGRAALGKV